MGRGANTAAGQATAQPTRGGGAHSEPLEAMHQALLTAKELGNIAESVRSSVAHAGVKAGTPERKKLNRAVNMLRHYADLTESALFLQLRDIRARCGEDLGPGEKHDKPLRYLGRGESSAERAKNGVTDLGERVRRLRELNALVAHRTGSILTARGVAESLQKVDRCVGQLNEVVAPLPA